MSCFICRQYNNNFRRNNEAAEDVCRESCMIEERGFKVEDKDAANGAIGEGEEGG